MEVFRIAQPKYAKELKASGLENRWNFKGQKVIYSAGSRSLACLECLVHSSGEALFQPYEIMVIFIPDHIYIENLNPAQLPDQWNLLARPIACRTVGSEWIVSLRSAILMVPSAIIKNEYNYIFNVNHPEFSSVKIIANEPFLYDKRLMLQQ